MDLQGLKDVLSKYGNILIIKEGAVFSLLMKGENLSNIKKLQDIQSTVLDYAGDRYPVIEAFRNDDRYLCMILKPEQKSAIQLISDERQRQVEVEGFAYMHDDNHGDESLATAASCYALPDHKDRGEYVDTLWPWNEEYWKPTPNDRIRELVKAGALIAAEIERLQRLKKQKEVTNATN